MSNIEKGKQIKNCVEAIEKLEKADNMLRDKGYHAPSISIHIQHVNQVGTMEEVILDGKCMRYMIHKIIKEMMNIFCIYFYIHINYINIQLKNNRIQSYDGARRLHQ